MDISYVDIIILIPVLYGCYQGFCKGLIISLATMLGLALGVWGGFKFSHITAQFLNDTWQLDVPLLSFGVTFVIILLLVYLIGKLVEKSIDALSLGIFNKVGGLLAGAGRIIIILSVVSLFFDGINQKFELVEPAIMEESILYPPLQGAAKTLMPVFESIQEKGTAIKSDSTLVFP